MKKMTVTELLGEDSIYDNIWQCRIESIVCVCVCVQYTPIFIMLN